MGLALKVWDLVLTKGCYEEIQVAAKVSIRDGVMIELQAQYLWMRRSWSLMTTHVRSVIR
jgi:hypothetical protein